MSVFVFLTAGALLILGWDGSIARAADITPSSSSEQSQENQTKTLDEIQSQKQKRAFDASNERLLYQMAQTDGAGMADVPAPSWLEKEQNRQNKQQAGQAENKQ